jgi:hypothetical protein
MWKRSLLFVALAACSTSNAGPGASDAGAADASIPEVLEPDAGPAPLLACLRPSPGKDEYRPPFSKVGACTPAQLEEFEQCFGGDVKRCAAFTDLADNAGCVDDCLYKFDPREAHYGPIVVDRRVNEPGYLELRGISQPCVQAAWDAFVCRSLSCIDCVDADAKRCRAIMDDPSKSQCAEFDRLEKERCQTEAAAVSSVRADFTTKDGVAKVIASFCGSP